MPASTPFNRAGVLEFQWVVRNPVAVAAHVLVLPRDADPVQVFLDESQGWFREVAPGRGQDQQFHVKVIGSRSLRAVTGFSVQGM